MKTFIDYGRIDEYSIVLEDEVEVLVKMIDKRIIKKHGYDVYLTFTDRIKIEIVVNGRVRAYATV